MPAAAFHSEVTRRGSARALACTEAFVDAPGGAAWHDAPVKGDRVEVVVDVGETTKTYEIVATRAGRRVDVSNVRGVLEVSEVTRTGVVVRSARFMAGRVVAVVEHPARDAEQEGRARRPSNQSSLL